MVEVTVVRAALDQTTETALHQAGVLEAESLGGCVVSGCDGDEQQGSRRHPSKRPHQQPWE